MIESREDELVPLEPALLHAHQGWRWGIPTLREEDDEGEGLTRSLQQFLRPEEGKEPVEELHPGD